MAVVPRHKFIGEVATGAAGVLMFIIGFISTGLIIVVKLYRLYAGFHTMLVTENPLFYIALTTMIIGTQLFLAGFLGEIILRTKNNEERYKIANELN